VPQDSIAVPIDPPAPLALDIEVNGEVLAPDTAFADYVGMTKLDVGVQLDLLARYSDWFQVQTPEGQVGWVLGQYLTVGPGVAERVEVVTQAPDANPALIGLVQERNVNLRGGPAVAYDKRGELGAGAQDGAESGTAEQWPARDPASSRTPACQKRLDLLQSSGQTACAAAPPPAPSRRPSS
jgi:hypothetical protein